MTLSKLIVDVLSFNGVKGFQHWVFYIYSTHRLCEQIAAYCKTDYMKTQCVCLGVCLCVILLVCPFVSLFLSTLEFCLDETKINGENDASC